MGSKLKETREKMGITQEELEKASGVSRQTISAIENGKTTNVTSNTLLALAKAMQTTVDAIFFEERV